MTECGKSRAWGSAVQADLAAEDDVTCRRMSMLRISCSKKIRSDNGRSSAMVVGTTCCTDSCQR